MPLLSAILPARPGEYWNNGKPWRTRPAPSQSPPLRSHGLSPRTVPALRRRRLLSAPCRPLRSSMSPGSIRPRPCAARSGRQTANCSKPLSHRSERPGPNAMHDLVSGAGRWVGQGVVSRGSERSREPSRSSSMSSNSLRRALARPALRRRCIPGFSRAEKRAPPVGCPGKQCVRDGVAGERPCLKAASPPRRPRGLSSGTESANVDKAA